MMGEKAHFPFIIFHFSFVIREFNLEVQHGERAATTA